METCEKLHTSSIRVPYGLLMKNTKTKVKLSTKRDLELLEIRREPFWQAIDGVPGRSVGVRKTDNGIFWLARQAGANGKKYVQLALKAQNFTDAIKEATTALFDQIDSGLTFSDITVEKMFDRYCENVKPSPTNSLTKKSLGRLRNVKLRDLRKADIVLWVESDDLLLGHKNQPRSVTTIQRMIAPLRASLNMALHQDLLQDGNWKLGFSTRYLGERFAKAGVEKTESTRRYITPEQRQLIIDNSLPDEKIWLELCATTPLRPGDWGDRRIKNFDLETCSLFVESKKHPRYIVPNKKVCMKLKNLCKGKSSEQLIFTYRNDGVSMWDKQRWNEAIKIAARKAHIDGEIALQDMRHSVITDLIESGLSPTQVAMMAGTSTQMIERHYAKPLSKLHELALERIAL